MRDGTAPEPRVIIADDHAVIREALRMILEGHGIAVVAEAADGASAITNARALRPDVVLMDLRMPRTDGIAATREIVSQGFAAVLALTSFDEDELVFGAIRAGAAGFLLKTTAAAALVDAVRRVAAGEGVLDPRVTRRALAALAGEGAAVAADPDPDPGPGLEPVAHRQSASRRAAALPGLEELTEREREVLDRLVEGESNARIGAALGISLPTVKTHVSRILVKLGAENRVQVLARLRRAGAYGARGGANGTVE